MCYASEELPDLEYIGKVFLMINYQIFGPKAWDLYEKWVMFRGNDSPLACQ